MQKFQTAITSPTGDIIPNAVITILTSTGSTPIIYAGNGVNPYPTNQVTTNSQGEFSFYAANGRYSYTVAATNYVTEAYTDFLLFDPADAPAGTYSIDTEYQLATAGQTVITLTQVTYIPGSNNLSVYVNGARLIVNVDYAETSSTQVTFTNALALNDEVVCVVGAEISEAVASSNVSFLQAGTGAVSRSVRNKLRDTVSVKDFGAVGDGVTDDTAAIQAAVTQCFNTSDQLYWPDGTYLTTASISNFHAVRHVGPGVHSRSGITWPVTPERTSLRRLYVSPSGNNTNDGLTSSQPRLTIQGCVDVVNRWGPVVGRQQIIGAAGTYAESVTLPDGLAQENNYLEFKFPSAPGVRGDPSSWPVGGAILDGTGLTGNGFAVGRYNKVYIEYLLVRDWYDTGLSATQQVVSGITVDEFSLLYTYGVSAQGNGWNNIYIEPCGVAIVTGGILDGARYGINNTAGRLSLTANGSTYTTVRNALEYGLYAKHNSSAVLDYTEFVNCGQVAGAESYGAALFAYKSGTSIDTRNCTFKQNNIVYHSRSGGHIATAIPSTDTLGTGGDVNDRIWMVEGFGNNDAINYRSIAPRDLAQVFTIATTTSTVTTTVVDNICTVPAEYFQNTDQYMEIEIYGSASTQAAVVRPTWTSSAPTNYGFGVFSVAANTEFKIKLLIYPTGAASQFVQFDNIGATSTGASIGNTTSTGVFGTLSMTFKVRGEVTSGGTLEIKRVRVVLWG